MRFDIVTLFPELFTPFISLGVTRRAYELGAVTLNFWNPRDYASGVYRRVDDRPFGGGPGMVMMAEPLALCVQAIQASRQAANAANAANAATTAPAPVVLFSPVGETLTHEGVAHWAASDGAILVCGRYEGVDQRFIDELVTHQISLGDFVLSGGEIAAFALLDALARLQPGVLNDAQSHALDSFNPELGGLLDCPHYTRPEIWRDLAVPAVLMSGHHAQIDLWRDEQRRTLTAQHRPDLLPLAMQSSPIKKKPSPSKT
jgi:tRNA (guanine37-N1)-methyltransferase